MKFIVDAAHSNIDFSILYLGRVRLTGSFERFEGNIESPDDHFDAGTVYISIEAASIRTNNQLRDEALRKAPFFESARYPLIVFQSHSWIKNDESEFRVSGQLIVNGKTQLITAEVHYHGSSVDMNSKTGYFFSLNLTMDRLSLGMLPAPVTSAGIPLLSNQVVVEASFSFQPLPVA